MTTACPYCGATLNLNYCVVCGRQSNPSLNRMGSLKTVARNTDVTQRLDDPLQAKKYKRYQTLLRFRKSGLYLLKLGLGGVIIAALILCVSNQAADLFRMQSLVAPWMKSHRIVFPNQLPLTLSNLKESIVNATQSGKAKQPAKHRHK